MNNDIIQWLLSGDPSIQFQTKRDLLEEIDTSVQETISQKGWGKSFLSKQSENGHWGQKFYQPKWISTHYTLLDLKLLCTSKNTPDIKEVLIF